MTKPECIYVATRLTAPHPVGYLYNLKQSLKAGAELWRKGHIPFVPGLDILLYIEFDGNYGIGGSMPYENSLEWLRRCDSVLIYNGLEDSKGVNMEYEEAKKLDKKIYYNLDEVPYVDE